MHFSRDFFVGLFVVLALVILAVVTIALRQLDFFGNRNTYYVVFSDVKRLDIGASVQASGVKVGEITNMEFIGGVRPVRVTMRIKRIVHLYSNAQIKVVSAQVIGDTLVNIINSGSPGKGAVELSPGATITGYEEPELESRVGEVSDQLQAVLKSAGSYLNDPQIKVAVKRTVTNMASVSGKMDKTFDLVNQEFLPLIADLRKTTAALDGFLKDSQRLVNQASSDVAKTSQSIRDTSGQFGHSAQSMEHEVQRLSAELQKVIGQLDQAIKTNQQPLNATIKEFSESSRALRDMLRRIDQGQGTLGLLLNDPRPFEQLRLLLDGLSSKLTGRQESLFPAEASPRGATSTREPVHP